jgi:hypothetical protein
VNITDVIWTRDHHGKPVLELRLDGHPARILSGQRTELTDRGIVDGVVFLRSERGSQLPNANIRGDYAPAYRGLDLVGCTDDPGVFALYREMCAAIRADTWREGARPVIA